MLSSLFYSNLNRDLISHYPILFMYLKLHKLVPDLQHLSRGYLKQVMQHVQMQSYWCQFADIFGFIVTIFLNDLVDKFLGGDSD